MIHPLSKVQIIDSLQIRSYSCTIESLFDQFIYRVKDNLLDLNNSKIFVNESAGYTKILSIKKVSLDDCLWTNVKCGDSHIVVTGETIIPTYDRSREPYIGFHGEVKYHIFPKKVWEISPERDCIAVYSRNTKMIGMIQPVITAEPSDGVCEAYVVNTKSGFMTANDIFLYANNDDDQGNEIIKSADILK